MVYMYCHSKLNFAFYFNRGGGVFHSKPSKLGKKTVSRNEKVDNCSSFAYLCGSLGLSSSSSSIFSSPLSFCTCCCMAVRHSLMPHPALLFLSWPMGCRMWRAASRAGWVCMAPTDTHRSSSYTNDLREDKQKHYLIIMGDLMIFS